MQTSHARVRGRYRTLEADRYTQKKNHSCVIMANGFIENGYWYQSRVLSQNLADYVSSLGFDVHVLSFPTNPEVFSASESLPVDASFSDIVVRLLPEYFDRHKDKYTSFHMIGHSYGVTLLLAYLLGYQYSQQKGKFEPERLLLNDRRSKFRSFLSLAGYFGINWDFFEEKLFPPISGWFPKIFANYSQEKNTCSLFSISQIRRKISRLPTGHLGKLRPLAKFRAFQELMQMLPSKFLPFVHYPNAHKAALWDAVFHGSGHEPWETFDTMLSLTGKNFGGIWKSRALAELRAHLKLLDIPVCFIQGDLDLMSPPWLIKKEAFEALSSDEKHVFLVLKNTGHQDLLLSHNPQPLYENIKDWLKKNSV